MKSFTYSLLVWMCLVGLSASDRDGPRLLINAEELAAKRLQWQSPTYAPMKQIILQRAAADSGEALSDLYDLRIRWHLLAWLMTKDTKHLQRIEQLSTEMLALPAWADRRHKGLARAYALTTIAIAYDFTAVHWGPELRSRCSEQLFTVAQELMKSMGKGGNNRLASNWMAVRYAAAGLALLACDEAHTKGPLFVAYGQLINHFHAALAGGAWSPEGLGYFIYPMSFTALFAQAAERAGLGDLRHDVPNMIDAAMLAYHATIEGEAGPDKYGYQIDLANDNPGLGFRGLAGNLLWLAAHKPTVQDHLRHMFETRVGREGPNIYEPWDASFLPALLHYTALEKAPEDIKRPGLLFHDPVHGIVVSRNGWHRENDIVVALNGPHRRPWGIHRGPDTNALRIIGLNGVFVTGAGRTGNPTASTGVFPEKIPTKVPHEELGAITIHAKDLNGSFVASISGNQFGLSAHQRRIAVDYAAKGSSLITIIQDEAVGARRWRLATLANNRVRIHQNGFTIQAPSGSTMHGTILSNGTQQAPRVQTESIPRGTSNGIAMYYHGKEVTHNTVIDISCHDSMTIVLTLDAQDDRLSVVQQDGILTVGNNSYVLSGQHISGGGLPQAGTSEE